MPDTSNAYASINGPFRRKSAGSKHPFPITLYWLTQALKVLRASCDVSGSTVQEAQQVVWRGTHGIMVTESFLRDGGTEPAPLSATRSRDVALEFALKDVESSDKRGTPMLLKIVSPDFMCRLDFFLDKSGLSLNGRFVVLSFRGADLSWLSVYPGEEEVSNRAPPRTSGGLTNSVPLGAVPTRCVPQTNKNNKGSGAGPECVSDDGGSCRYHSHPNVPFLKNTTQKSLV
jgi:hypothetical protein